MFSFYTYHTNFGKLKEKGWVFLGRAFADVSHGMRSLRLSGNAGGVSVAGIHTGMLAHSLPVQ